MSNEPQETPVTEAAVPAEPTNAEPVQSDPIPETAPVPAHPTGIIITGGDIQEPTGAVYEGEEIDENYDEAPTTRAEPVFEEQVEPLDVDNGGE